MVNLWINSKTCQKYRILLSARQRYYNYLELSKKCFGGYDAVALTMLYLKVLQDIVS